MSKNTWNADPEKYRQLSQPFDSQEHAETCIKAFQAVVNKAREEFKIPDAMIQIGCTFLSAEGQINYMNAGCGWGDQRNQVKLAQQAYQREMAHLMIVATALATDHDAWDYFITDPEMK